MPDNQIPAAKSDPTDEPTEFNFANPATDPARIRRRSLKTKQAGLIKPNGTVPPTARELEREAPPLSAEEASKLAARPVETKATTPVIDRTEPAAKPPVEKVAEPVAPPRTTPAISVAAAATRPPTTSASVTAPVASTTSTTPKTTTAPSSTSPHPTRPATLYYSSQPRKDKEASPAPTTAAPMKTIPTASTTTTAASKPATSTAQPASTTRPAATTTPSSAASTIPVSITRHAATSSTAPRSSTTSDYRANIERQSREQKSVGSILSYVVYGLIAFFVIGAALAGYGGYTLSKRINDQSVTVSDLDTKYAAANKDLTAKLAATQETLSQAQARISRQDDLISKQQDALNRLIAATNDNTKAVATERQTRAQETATLRSRVREVENEIPAPTR